MAKNLKVGITLGDYNGIGPELILRTLSSDLVLNYCTPVVYANSYVFKVYAQLLEMDPIRFNVANRPKDIIEGAINLRICSKDKIEVEPGTPSVQSAKFALESLEMAVADVKEGVIQNILTAPIDKHTIRQAGLEFNGHTGYFQQQFESEALMILVDDDLRVAMVTGHTALENVPSQITQDKIVGALESFHQALVQDFSIENPRIAVLGLNPHSGDRGLMGNDEAKAITPAIKEAQEKGILAFGPYPPDGFFGSANSANFDGILGMYHDQVLIPFKQAAFSTGVNYTAGLPIIRTSPDHGTAYDLAGKGEADLASFVNALYLINKLHRNRVENYEANKKFLEFREHRKEKFSIGVPDLN